MKAVYFIIISLSLFIIFTSHRVAPETAPIYYCDTSNYCYLTFNIRWNKGPVLDIAKHLRKHDVKAVFFVSEFWAKAHPEIVEMLLVDGHDLGFRPDCSSLLYSCSQEIQGELVSFRLLMEEEYQYTPFLFRPPGGEFHGEMLYLAYKEGYYTTLWSVNLQETALKDKSNIICNLLHKNHRGSIILLQTAPSTAEILPQLLKYFEVTGQEIGVLSDYII